MLSLKFNGIEILPQPKEYKMNIQQLIKQVQEKTAIANDNLADATNSTRAMRQGNKRAATEALIDLKNDYRRLLLSTAAFVIVTGPQAKEFTDLATPESKAFNADSEGLYRKLVAQIDKRAYMNQAVASSFFATLGNVLEETAREIGVNSYPQLRFKAEYSQVIENEEQLVQLVKRAVNESLGSEMVGIYAVSSILEQALDRSHGDSFTPILLTTADDQLAVTLSNDLKRLSPNVFVVNASPNKPSKTIKNLPNLISIKGDPTREALDQLLEGIKARIV